MAREIQWIRRCKSRRVLLGYLAALTYFDMDAGPFFRLQRAVLARLEVLR